MLFLMAAIALFVPSVMAAEAPTYDEENKALFANGTPVTVEARTDGVAGALVKWNGGEKLLPADNSVFGGSHDSAAKIDSTSVTVNGGTLHNVFGGGLHKSYVGTAVVTINGGKFTGKVHGGGASSYAGSTCHQPWHEGNKENATTVVDVAIVTINENPKEKYLFNSNQKLLRLACSTKRTLSFIISVCTMLVIQSNAKPFFSYLLFVFASYKLQIFR